MSSRNLYRIVLFSLTLAAIVFFMASSINHEIREESANNEEKEGPRKAPSEFIIWESMGSTMLSVSAY